MLPTKSQLKLASLMLPTKSQLKQRTLLHLTLVNRLLLGIQSWKVVRMVMPQCTALFLSLVQCISCPLLGYSHIPGNLLGTLLTLSPLSFTEWGRWSGLGEAWKLARVTQLVSGSVGIKSFAFSIQYWEMTRPFSLAVSALISKTSWSW